MACAAGRAEAVRMRTQVVAVVVRMRTTVVAVVVRMLI